MLPLACTRRAALALAVLATAPLSSARPAKRSSAVTATVRNGTYSGLALPTFDQEVFFGVPFAQPPVGDLRLRQSVALNSSWTGVKPLTERVPQCAGDQTDGLATSEDCLYMNVLRPAGVSEGDDLPVAVWIHGGAQVNFSAYATDFVAGGINDPLYNASTFVAESVAMGKPVVQVSIAYPLSLLGWLNSPELAADGLQNIGLHDQRRALQWIQENIV